MDKNMKEHKKTFKFKIIVPTAVVLILLVAVMNVFQFIRFSKMGNTLINEKLYAIVNSLELYLADCEANTKMAATAMAPMPEVIDAILERDNEALLRIFNAGTELYRIAYFTITDKDGNVLVRTYEPESFGDSVSNQRNIKDALEGKSSTYYESGIIVKVSIRSGAPVYDSDGALVGAVSAGVRFDLDSEVNRLKSLFGCEATVFLEDTRIVTTIIRDGHSIVGTTLDPRIAEIVITNKQEYHGDAEILGERYKTFYKPLLNADGDAFATIFLGIPLAELESEMNRSIRDGIVLGLGGLVVATILLYFVISSISHPISKLSVDMHHIANGDLNIEVKIKSDDEVGKLGKSLVRVAGTLHKLLDDIDVMITEHKKGNVDYYLDSDGFMGDYKTLADNILELASFGMRDQLTRLPNRRSFDNRLELEWERAVRGRQSVSFLIMDIDKFKNYNDTFGHQQGDVTLQVVADTIKQSLNRSVDFTARWGGEEFVVLLPDTDANGAFGVAERIRKAVEGADIPCDDERGRKATISIGANTMSPKHEDSVAEFIADADMALYRAKETGRNKVVHVALES